MASFSGHMLHCRDGKGTVRVFPGWKHSGTGDDAVTAGRVP
ncbi:hypothetical protein ECO5101_24671, partial [Escherichia coli O157:H7 str. G5101]